MSARVTPTAQDGYAMAALLVGLAVMGVMLAAAMPAWRTMVQREKEAELVFRGQQYARAIGLYQRKYANAYPPSLDMLVEQRFLRKKYRDPMVKNDKGGEGDFQILYQGDRQQLRPGQAAGGPAGTQGGTRLGGAQGGVQSGQAGAISTPGSGGRPGGPPAPSGMGALGAGPRGGIVGVTSKSTKKSIRIYNGRSAYNEWEFVWTTAETRTGPATRPGMRPGQGGQRGPAGGPFRASDPRR